MVRALGGFVEARIGNRRNRRLGLGLAAALALALVALLGLPVSSANHQPDRDLRELVIREIVASEQLDSDLVVLQAVGESVFVPVFVPREDGQAIRAAREGQGSAALLVEQTVHGMGAEISAVLLDPGEGSLGGVLVVDQGGERLAIEISPGAAIATALSTGMPLLTPEIALETNGLDDADLRRLGEAEAYEPSAPSFAL